MLSGPLNQLNARLSLLHPLDCKRTPSARASAMVRKWHRGVETQERENTSSNPFSKTVFGPRTYDTFSPPPVCSHPVISLKGNKHRPGPIPFFLSPPKLVLEGALYIVRFPPQNRTIRFAPPFARESLNGCFQRGGSLQIVHDRLQLCTFVALLGALSKGNFRHKMTTLVGNHRHLWTST